MSDAAFDNRCLLDLLVGQASDFSRLIIYPDNQKPSLRVAESDELASDLIGIVHAFFELDGGGFSHHNDRFKFLGIHKMSGL